MWTAVEGGSGGSILVEDKLELSNDDGTEEKDDNTADKCEVR